MGQWVLAKVREWYILGIGLIFIMIIGVVGAYYAAPTSASSTAVESAAPNPQRAGSDAPAQASQTQTAERSASDRPARTASQTPSDQKSPAPPAATAPAPHNHTVAEKPVAVAQAAAPAPQSTGQATNQSGSAPALSADAEAGRLVYRKCQACHSLTTGKNGVGPSLGGIVGKKAGEVPGFNYSPAMKASGLTWDAATLDAYLADPQKKVPGNKMPFPGLKTGNERSSLIAYLVATSSSAVPAVAQQTPAAPPSSAPSQPAATPSDQAGMSYVPGIRYTLRSGIAEGRMVFIGVGGNIDGQVNPVLSAAEGQVVQITLLNGEGAEHDIVFADQGPTARSPRISGKGASTNIAFPAMKAGDYIYFCSLPGHQLAGMQGRFLVTPRPPPQTVVEADISQKSTEVPPPVGKRGPQTVRVDLVTTELEGRLAEGTTFGYWTSMAGCQAPCSVFVLVIRSMCI